MRYLLLIGVDETYERTLSDREMQSLVGEYMKFGEAAAAAGVLVSGERLRPADLATTVRVRNQKTPITDGPFAETKEMLGGFYILECRNLDEAIAWAARNPGARTGAIEVRPIWEREDYDPDRPA